MSKNSPDKNKPAEYKVFFRSSFIELDWGKSESDKDSPSEGKAVSAESLEPDKNKFFELEGKLEKLNEALSQKDQEIRDREIEIEKLKEEAVAARELEPKPDRDTDSTQTGAENLEVEEEAAEEEKKVVDEMKEDYEEKLSILSEREYELNRIEEELAQNKEELQNLKESSRGEEQKFSMDEILDKGKAMASSNQNLQAYFFFRLAVYLEPENITALNNLAISMYRLGFKDKAEVCMNKVLELDPGNEAAKTNLERIQKA